jgi:hypothetical protein
LDRAALFNGMTIEGGKLVEQSAVFPTKGGEFVPQV